MHEIQDMGSLTPRNIGFDMVLKCFHSMLCALIHCFFTESWRFCFGAPHEPSLKFSSNIFKWLSQWGTFVSIMGTVGYFVLATMWIHPRGENISQNRSWRLARHLHKSTFAKHLCDALKAKTSQELGRSSGSEWNWVSLWWDFLTKCCCNHKIRQSLFGVWRFLVLIHSKVFGANFAEINCTKSRKWGL